MDERGKRMFQMINYNPDLIQFHIIYADKWNEFYDVSALCDTLMGKALFIVISCLVWHRTIARIALRNLQRTRKGNQKGH